LAKRQPTYSESVFINCPFDDPYRPIRDAVIFAVLDCGFAPRCALEVDDGADLRFDKIQRIISGSRFGIHDISRTELDGVTHLPRFNMPLELGMFLAARHFGGGKQKSKNCLILDSERYRYRNFISDISGHDIEAHNNDPLAAIRCVRNWLRSQSGRRTIPGAQAIAARYEQFVAALPGMCTAVELVPAELTYADFTGLVVEWLET
jgi:hypothetical protein